MRNGVLPSLKGELRALYCTLELPNANPLKAAHAALAAAALAAYGFDAKADLLAQLHALNLAVAAPPFHPSAFAPARPRCPLRRLPKQMTAAAGSGRMSPCLSWN